MEEITPDRDLILGAAAEFEPEDFRGPDHDWTPDEIRDALQEMGWEIDGGQWFYYRGRNRVKMFEDDYVDLEPGFVGRWFVEVDMDWEQFLADRGT